MLKNAFYIVLVSFLLGCGGAFQNFRAYYNTYYNAEKNYRAGLEKVENQEEEIDITQPLRVHPSPVQAGNADFQKAIDKGARILRKFSESKWVDETLELIGKSYYYRLEYYSALEKFEEQYNVTEDPAMRQRSVIWKGRVLLDLELYSEAVAFLEEELEKPENEWREHLRGEAQVLLAEHQVQLENFGAVDDLLQRALTKIDKGPLKARAYFLYGQILEAEDRYGEALFAYTSVTENRPEFELLYWANLKRARVMRKMGNLQNAMLVYQRMRNDDKNVERLAEINYEIARTDEEMKNIERAVTSYKEILGSEKYTVPQEVRADTYFRLGQIYSGHYEKYQTAAAYFDSSSTFRTEQRNGIFRESKNPQTLAEAYGRYSLYLNQIQRLDSLLWLGSLPEAEFDSVIAEIRNRRIQKLREQGRERTNDSDVLVNISQSASGGAGSPESELYGFLNYRNSTLLAEARQQFRAVWGSRALVDNWRRIEAVSSGDSGSTDSAADNGNIAQTRNGEYRQATDPMQVDISEVPFTEEEKAKTRDELAVAKYELGNLFLLTLEQPDSAAQFFSKVVEEDPGHELVPKALYSLFEIYHSKGEGQKAQEYASKLRSEFPNSTYTRQLEERLKSGQNTNNRTYPEDKTLSSNAAAIIGSNTSEQDIAEELRNLAMANRNASSASLIHYEAIRHYIMLAREKTGAGAGSDSQNSGLMYDGAYWDSVRVVLDEYRKNFSGNAEEDEVEKLAEELNKKATKQDSGKIATADSQVETSSKRSVITCNELGIQPEIRSGMKNFISTVDFPEGIWSTILPAALRYEVQVNSAGEVESFKQLSPETEPKVENALETAMQEKLQFVPVELPDPESLLKCDISFPIRQYSSDSGVTSSIRAGEEETEKLANEQNNGGSLNQKSRERTIVTCSELGVTPEVRFGMNEFISSVEFPEGIWSMSLPAALRYEVQFNSAGDVKSYNRLSPNTEPEVEKALETALQENLQFTPVKLADPESLLKCEISFPIRQ